MELRQKLLDYIVESRLEFIFDHDAEEFIKNLLLNGSDETPFEELTDEELEALYYDITDGKDCGGIYSDEWANGPSEYDLGYGEEFPNE